MNSVTTIFYSIYNTISNTMLVYIQSYCESSLISQQYYPSQQNQPKSCENKIVYVTMQTPGHALAFAPNIIHISGEQSKYQLTAITSWFSTNTNLRHRKYLELLTSSVSLDLFIYFFLYYLNSHGIIKTYKRIIFIWLWHNFSDDVTGFNFIYGHAWCPSTLMLSPFVLLKYWWARGKIPN